MLPWLDRGFGNPSNSLHKYGREARAAVDWARQQVASLINASPDEIYFTSGATEANNLVLQGFPPRAGKNGLIISNLEHESVANPAMVLKERGNPVNIVHSDKFGVVSADRLEKLLRSTSVDLLSVIHVQGEIGSINPIEKLAGIAKKYQCRLHTDAAQSVGKIPVDVQKLNVDYLTIAAHKMYGPKGVGALYIRRNAPLEALLYGAGHEQGMRPGTENVPYLVGFGEACRIAADDLQAEQIRQAKLRDELFDQLSASIPDIRLNGHPELRHPGNLHISLRGINSIELLSRLPDYALSVGSACHSEHPMENPLIQSLEIPEDYASGAVRIGIGRGNTHEQLSQFAEDFIHEYDHLKKIKV